MPNMSQEWAQLIQDCENREERLTDWERSFIDSVKDQVTRGKGLSPKQEERLGMIWEKTTSKG